MLSLSDALHKKELNLLLVLVDLGFCASCGTRSLGNDVIRCNWSIKSRHEQFLTRRPHSFSFDRKAFVRCTHNECCCCCPLNWSSLFRAFAHNCSTSFFLFRRFRLSKRAFAVHFATLRISHRPTLKFNVSSSLINCRTLEVLLDPVIVCFFSFAHHNIVRDFFSLSESPNTKSSFFFCFARICPPASPKKVLDHFRHVVSLHNCVILSFALADPLTHSFTHSLTYSHAFRLAAILLNRHHITLGLSCSIKANHHLPFVLFSLANESGWRSSFFAQCVRLPTILIACS